MNFTITGYFIPSDDEGKVTWINNLRTKLPSYAPATLGTIPAPEVGLMQVDADFFTWAVQGVHATAEYAQGWTTGREYTDNAPLPAGVASAGTAASTACAMNRWANGAMT